MIRILLALPTLDEWNGQTRVVMEYYDKLKEIFAFDFAIHTSNTSKLEEKVLENGSRVYHLPNLKMNNYLRILENIKNIFDKNHYDIVHVHALNYGFMFFKYKKKYGFKAILHNHTTKSSDYFLRRVRNFVLNKKSIKGADLLISCSREAGLFAYGKNDFTVINNAIDSSVFMYSSNYKEEMKKKYGIKKTKIIGCIGRFCNQKNQLFLLDVVEKLVKNDQDILLIMVGKSLGEYYKNIKQQIINKKIENNVLIVDPVLDIYKMYSLFDLVVFPSTYEGFGNVVLEAQSCGCNVIASNCVPMITNVTGKVVYLGLDDINAWCEKITLYLGKSKIDGDYVRKCLIENKFEITSACETLVQLYTKGVGQK